MNIFAVDQDPIAAALALHDTHVRSQAAEAFQVASDATRRLGVAPPCAAMPYNPNGRFARWAVASRANAAWLLDHGTALCEEHLRRFGHGHWAEGRLIEIAPVLLLAAPDGEPTAFAMDKATTAYAEQLHLDPVAAYRRRYHDKTSPRGKPAAWTNTERPVWLAETQV